MFWNGSNAIGAHGGSYCIYRALAVGIGALDTNHRPDFTNTLLPLKIGPHPQWGDPTKIVSLDPFGQVVAKEFAQELGTGLDIRPSIALTKAHMRLPEVDEAVKRGDIPVDGKVIVGDRGDISVVKVAVEPVWYLPGVAERFGI